MLSYKRETDFHNVALKCEKAAYTCLSQYSKKIEVGSGLSTKPLSVMCKVKETWRRILDSSSMQTISNFFIFLEGFFNIVYFLAFHLHVRHFATSVFVTVGNFIVTLLDLLATVLDHILYKDVNLKVHKGC